MPLKSLLQWGTLNGAEALSYDKLFGSLEIGKSPGLVHINMQWEGEDTSIKNTSARRIL